MLAKDTDIDLNIDLSGCKERPKDSRKKYVQKAMERAAS